MADDGNARIARVNDVFTEEALKEHDGKKVPLKDRPGGKTIGEATLRFDDDEKALIAHFNIEDPVIADFFKNHPQINPFIG